MKNVRLRKILIGILIISIMYLTHDYIINDYFKFDRHYTNQTEKYEVVHVKLKKSTLQILRNFYNNPFSMFPSAGVYVDFTIDSDSIDFLKKHEPQIYLLFEERLVESIHVLHNGKILFQLKWCDRPNCIKDNKGFHGFFTHYLSKDNVKFKYYSSTHLVDHKKFGEWNYYIVWTLKG